MKRLLLSAAILMASAALAGCGGLKRPEKETAAANNEVVREDNMSVLQDGGFYIRRSDETYDMLYVQNANYEVGAQTYSAASDSRTLWFKDDWPKIPTMYTGDELIFKSSVTFDENFYMERFEYVGYTVGVTSLKKTASGRYSYSTKPEDRNINPSSNAKQLYDIPTEIGIIDRIGGGDLREGNVSSGGCILGLEEGKNYEAEVYAGTFLHKYVLTADSIALTSMEMYKTVEYDFMQSEIIRIHFPEYFHSGYYLLNGFGLVRYVVGSSYDETTDFNIPNVEPDEEATEEETSEEATEKERKLEDRPPVLEDVEIVNFTLDEQARVRLVITYDEGEGGYPVGVLVSTDKLYSMRASTDRTLSIIQTLPAGDYRIEIQGLDGRGYEFHYEELNRDGNG